MTVAARVAEETGSLLGQAVGYGIRFEDVSTPVRSCLIRHCRHILVTLMVLWIFDLFRRGSCVAEIVWAQSSPHGLIVCVLWGGK